MIGIFDSGLGGLTIFREIEKELPEYDYIYLGDNARAPYGDHSQETILKYTKEALAYLFDEGCILVILACSTASAEALRQIQQRWLPKHYPDRNVLGVVRPLVEVASEKTNNKNVGVLATKATVASHAYKKELMKLDKKIAVQEQACRLLVPLIEEGYESKLELRRIVKKYLRSVKDSHADVVILGCTHYGIIVNDIERYLGASTTVLNSGGIVAEKLAEYLKRHPEFEERITKGEKRVFLTTEETEFVKSLVKKFLGRSIELKKVDLTVSRS